MPDLKISVCTYQSNDFEVMLIDPETGHEVMLSGSQELSVEDFDTLNKLAPACVWSSYRDTLDLPPMVIIEDGTIWYFDLFDQFMEAWDGAPAGATYRIGSPRLLRESGGVNDAWEFLTAKDDSLKLLDLPVEELQRLRRSA